MKFRIGKWMVVILAVDNIEKALNEIDNVRGKYGDDEAETWAPQILESYKIPHLCFLVIDLPAGRKVMVGGTLGFWVTPWEEEIPLYAQEGKFLIPSVFYSAVPVEYQDMFSPYGGL